jgi:hypothetical protein
MARAQKERKGTTAPDDLSFLVKYRPFTCRPLRHDTAAHSSAWSPPSSSPPSAHSVCMPDDVSCDDAGSPPPPPMGSTVGAAQPSEAVRSSCVAGAVAAAAAPITAGARAGRFRMSVGGPNDSSHSWPHAARTLLASCSRHIVPRVDMPAAEGHGNARISSHARMPACITALRTQPPSCIPFCRSPSPVWLGRRVLKYTTAQLHPVLPFPVTCVAEQEGAQVREALEHEADGRVRPAQPGAAGQVQHPQAALLEAEDMRGEAGVWDASKSRAVSWASRCVLVHRSLSSVAGTGLPSAPAAPVWWQGLAGTCLRADMGQQSSHQGRQEVRRVPRRTVRPWHAQCSDTASGTSPLRAPAAPLTGHARAAGQGQ